MLHLILLCFSILWLGPLGARSSDCFVSTQKSHQACADCVLLFFLPYPPSHAADLVLLVGSPPAGVPPTTMRTIRNNAGGAWNHALFWKVGHHIHLVLSMPENQYGSFQHVCAQLRVQWTIGMCLWKDPRLHTFMEPPSGFTRHGLSGPNAQHAEATKGTRAFCDVHAWLTQPGVTDLSQLALTPAPGLESIYNTWLVSFFVPSCRR